MREAARAQAGALQLQAPVQPRGVALAWGHLWVLKEGQLWRVGPDGDAQASSLPEGGAALLTGGPDRLAVSSAGGLFVRRAPDGAWEQAIRGDARLIGTRHPRFPVVAVLGGTLSLLDATTGLMAPLEAPFPAEAALAALVSGDARARPSLAAGSPLLLDSRGR